VFHLPAEIFSRRDTKMITMEMIGKLRFMKLQFRSFSTTSGRAPSSAMWVFAVMRRSYGVLNSQAVTSVIAWGAMD